MITKQVHWFVYCSSGCGCVDLLKTGALLLWVWVASSSSLVAKMGLKGKKSLLPSELYVLCLDVD